MAEKRKQKARVLELTVAKGVGALRKKLDVLDKQFSDISVIDPAEYKLKMCVHPRISPGFLFA